MKYFATFVSVFSAIFLAGTAFLAGAAWASQPVPWQMTFQPAATPIMERVTAFNELVFWIIVVITLFVLALLLWIIVRFR
ncbi:MAG: cytochrome c oxidase subunit II, partial [Proteobacteria bacterium]|nr:cytochrome c oxidase subunit II [Pseudomonadota bacterium]